MRASWTAQAARTFVVNVAGVAMGLALQLVLARVLGVTEYGRYVYVITWVTVLSMVCLLGFDAASLRFLAEHRARGEDGLVRTFLRLAQRRALALSTVVGMALAAAAALLPSAALQTPAATFMAGAVLLPMWVLFLLHGYSLLGLNRAAEALGLQLLARPLLIITGCLALAWIWHGRVGALDALVLTLTMTALVAGLEARRVRSLVPAVAESVDTAALRQRWSRTAGTLFLITLAQQVLANGDILIVGAVMGTTEAGIYALAAKVAALVSFATASINFVLAPTIAGLHARGERAELQAAVTTATRAAFLFAVLVLAAMLLGGGWLLGRFGAAFERGYPVLALLCLGQAAVAFNGTTGFLLTMTGHHEQALRLIGFSAGLMVVLAVPLGLGWGAPGVAAAAAIAQGVRSLVLGRSAHKQLGIRASVAA